MRVKLTDHASDKLRVLRRHGVKVTRRLVDDTLNNPERVLQGLEGRQIAERAIDENHVLRVVFIRQGHRLLVVTMYPARRGRY